MTNIYQTEKMLLAAWQPLDSYDPDSDRMVQVLCKVVEMEDDSYLTISTDDHATGDLFVSIGFSNPDMMFDENESSWFVAGWNMEQDCFADARGFEVIAWQPLAYFDGNMISE